MPPLPLLLRDAVAEYGLVDVRGDGGEDQALKLGRIERLDFPLHRLAGVELVSAGEPWPTRFAGLPRGCGQLVLAHLVVGEQDALHVASAVGAGHPVALDVGA
ncbi:hypothetical protein ACWGI8_27265 [Streptomyces sp. NPDC054841]